MKKVFFFSDCYVFFSFCFFFHFDLCQRLQYKWPLKTMQMVIISAELATDFKLKTNTVMYIYNSCAGFGVFQALKGLEYVVAEPSEEFSVSTTALYVTLLC